jgi:hypothetical protein
MGLPRNGLGTKHDNISPNSHPLTHNSVGMAFYGGCCKLPRLESPLHARSKHRVWAFPEVRTIS